MRNVADCFLSEGALIGMRSSVSRLGYFREYISEDATIAFKGKLLYTPNCALLWLLKLLVCLPLEIISAYARQERRKAYPLCFTFGVASFPDSQVLRSIK